MHPFGLYTAYLSISIYILCVCGCVMVPEGCACGVDPKQLMCIGLNSWPRKPKEKKKKKRSRLSRLAFTMGTSVVDACREGTVRACFEVWYMMPWDIIDAWWDIDGIERRQSDGLAACRGILNFPILWSSDPSTVSYRVGLPPDHPRPVSFSHYKLMHSRTYRAHESCR